LIESSATAISLAVCRSAMRTSAFLSKTAIAIKVPRDSHLDIHIRLPSSNKLFASPQLHHGGPGSSATPQAPCGTETIEGELRELCSSCRKTFDRSASYGPQGSEWPQWPQPHLSRPLRQSKQRPSQRLSSSFDKRVALREVSGAVPARAQT
jgi:hypothetical protein